MKIADRIAHHEERLKKAEAELRACQLSIANDLKNMGSMMSAQNLSIRAMELAAHEARVKSENDILQELHTIGVNS